MKIANPARLTVASALLALAPTVFAQGAVKQTADVLGQANNSVCQAQARPLVADDGATIIRTKTGISASINMPTPAPGTYCYPPPNPFQTVAPVPGTPEVFTGWLFIFNDPENCTTPYQCLPMPADYASGRGAAYNFAGHAVSGGGGINLVGHVSVGEDPFFPPPPGVPMFFPLDDPEGAEVHIAVAPHGVLVPELLPQQINTPVGTPAHWWVALFPAP